MQNMHAMKQLLDIKQLSRQLGRPIRQIRGFVQGRKIPFLKLGHRSLLFDATKVEKALAKYEIREIGAK